MSQQLFDRMMRKLVCLYLDNTRVCRRVIAKISMNCPPTFDDPLAQMLDDLDRLAEAKIKAHHLRRRRLAAKML